MPFTTACAGALFSPPSIDPHKVLRAAPVLKGLPSWYRVPKVCASAPLTYDFISVDPDIMRFAWADREDYVIARLAKIFRGVGTATSVSSWISEAVEGYELTLPPGNVAPEILHRMAAPPCGTDTKPGRCGDCLRCSIVMEPWDAIVVEAFFAVCMDTVSNIALECDGPGGYHVALWGLVTLSWSWEALVGLLGTDCPFQFAAAADYEEFWWKMFRYLTEKSPLAALQVLADGAQPDTILVSKKDLLPFFTHPDRAVRQAAFSALNDIFKGVA